MNNNYSFTTLPSRHALSGDQDKLHMHGFSKSANQLANINNYY